MIIVMTEKLPASRGELQTVKTHGGVAIRYVDSRGNEEWNPSLDRISDLRRKPPKIKIQYKLP